MLLKCNLFPWREARRRRQKQQLGIACALGSACALFGVFLQHRCFREHFQEQEQSQRLLQEEGVRLEQQIATLAFVEAEEKRWRCKEHTLALWQADSRRVKDLLERVAKEVPEEITLLSLARERDRIVLEGRAPSHEAITCLVQKLTVSSWVASVTVQRIQFPNFQMQWILSQEGEDAI